jgi:hypothetical protein
MPKPTRFARRKLIRVVLIFLSGIIVLLVLAIVVITLSPSTGARGADFLRSFLGPKPVAYLEQLVFKVQDTARRIQYSLEGNTPVAPWQIPSSPVIINTHIVLPTDTFTPLPFSPLTPTFPSPLTQTPAIHLPTSTPTITLTLTATSWQPAYVPPIGSLEGEGVWEPYIHDNTGVTVGFRTYLQPDPVRPYVTIAVVAFDLRQVHLHYVLGIDEPYVPNAPARSGTIPAEDLKAGVLLAAFNGGFKSINGHYGVMFNNLVVIQPMMNMGTVAIYKDGSIRIGEWGVDITYTTDMVTFRQNCPLIVHNGEINPQVYNDSVNDWGGTVNGDTITFRSGLGISQDGNTLYYFAGQQVSMPVLAKSMLDAGAYQAMQLDINNYYVIFTEIHPENNRLVATALLPQDMKENINRFLQPYGRDFFYITAQNLP